MKVCLSSEQGDFDSQAENGGLDQREKKKTEKAGLPRQVANGKLLHIVYDVIWRTTAIYVSCFRF
jgi:hypothetical protein